MWWIRRQRRAWLTAPFRAVTYTGTGKTWFVVFGVLGLLDLVGLHVLPAQRTFLRAASTALLAYAVGSVVKRLVRRPRPAQTLPGYDPAVAPPTCYSFPSSHAAAAVAFFVALEIVGHPWAHAVGVWALAVALSRFYLGVHYPTDIAGGAVIGVGCGASVLLARSFFAG